MSADNFYAIAQNPDTKRWHVFMGFMSDDEFTPTWRAEDKTYDTELAALHSGMDRYSEYGVHTVGWPELFDVPGACPKCHGDDDGCSDCDGFGFDVWTWEQIRGKGS